MHQSKESEHVTMSDLKIGFADFKMEIILLLEKNNQDLKAYVHEGIETVLKAQDRRFDAVEKRMDGIDRRFDLVDKRFVETEGRMIERFERVEAKIEKCVKKEDLQPFIKRIEALEDEVYP